MDLTLAGKYRPSGSSQGIRSISGYCLRRSAISWSHLRKLFGITFTSIALIPAMNLKAIIALLMGLVIQLSQVQACLAATSTGAVGAKAHSKCCCEGLQSCPCASDRSPDQKPTPLIPATVDLKWLISKTTESSSLDALIIIQPAAVVATASRAEARSAYAGVPLAVAFCRFVI